MTSAHLPTDSSLQARTSLRERLERASRQQVADQAAAFALAHLDPAGARSWLVAHEGAARGWPEAELARLLALLAELAIAADDRRGLCELGELCHRFSEACDPGLAHRLLSQLTAAELETQPMPALLERSLERAPGHAGLLRVASDRALRAGSSAAHALLTRLGRADASQATIQHVYRSRRGLVSPGGPGVRAAILSSYTVDALVPYLDLELRALGLNPEIYVAPFNSWTQEMLAADSGLGRFAPEIALLLVSIDDLLPALAGGASLKELHVAGKEAVARIQFAAERFAERFESVLLVTSFHSAYRSPEGVLDTRGPSRQQWIAELNAELAEILATLPRSYLIDLEELIARRPGGPAEQPKLRYLAGMRLGESVMGEVARACARYVAPLKGLTRKCVVLDLDGTLWGGTVGEDGIDGIRLGSTSPGIEYQDFQRYLATLGDRGILLAVNSKNNYEDAIEVIRSHPGMILRESAFSAIRINWQPKAENMAAIAEELGLGVDQMVFLDDHPNERELMRQAFPRVLVPDLPHDPALYRSVIELEPTLQTLVVTAEDRGRREQYQAIRERNVAKSESKSLASYLESLAIEVEILAADDGQLPRLLQLFQRTNQFNLTTRRFELGELAACARDPRCRLLALKARDRFGDHGLVAAALVRKERGEWRIDSFLMSCRVIGYGIETAFLSAIASEAEGEVAALVGEFIPTKKNAPARDFYPRHGFVRVGDEGGSGSEHWRLELGRGGVAWPQWIAREMVAGGGA